MHDLDTAQLRRLASESARRSQKQLRLMLLIIHGFLYLAAILVMATMLFGMSWVFDVLWNNVDLSLVIGGLFLGWGVGLMLHGASVLVDSGWMERQLRQRAAAGALGRALLEEQADEPEVFTKPKRAADELTDYALNDDGELAPAEIEESHSAKLKN